MVINIKNVMPLKEFPVLELGYIEQGILQSGDLV